MYKPRQQIGNSMPRTSRIGLAQGILGNNMSLLELTHVTDAREQIPRLCIR